MKKILVVLSITTFLFTLLILAQKSDLTIENRWKNVQELADKQLPESALKEVEIILNQAQEEKNSVEIIKALVYKMRFILEKNPDEAPALIKDFEAFTEKSTDHAERALLHSMTADLYAQYFQNQSFKIIQRTELKGIIPDDIKEWTKNIFFDKINKHLTASLENKVLLQNTATLKYAALLEIGEDSPVLQPTLFDFLAYRRIEILQQISQTTNQKNPLLNAELFSEMPQFVHLKLDSTYNTTIENPIIESYQQLLSFRLNEKNVLAFLFADLQYLRFIKENTQILNADSLYLSALKSLKKQYFDNEAVVEVYAAIANYYLEKSNLNENISFKRIAYSICNEGIKRFPDYKRTSMLENLKQDITQQNISINYNQLVKPNTDLKIKINSSNITELKLSVYKLNTSAQNYYSYKQKNRNSKEFYPDTTLFETRLIKVEPDENFGNVETEIKIKTADYGIYEFNLQKSDNNIPAQCTLGTFTVTDLAYINRTNKPETVDLYVLDRMSGKPQSKVNVSRFYSKWAGSGYEIIQANQRISNKYGFIQFPKLSNNYDNIYFFEKGNDKYLSSATNTYFFEQNYYENKNARISLFTDRSLYRPGQTVYFKAISYFLNSKKQEANVGAAYEVKLLDANRQEISKKKFKTNDFGSFAGEFILPEAGLNGRFQLQIGNFSQTFWVEEYKRPTFEVKIDKPKTEISFGEKVALIANVKAFAGYNIGDAKVKYRIVRRTHRYCWWWNQPDKEITNGTTNSKPDGTFEIVFIPEKTLNEITQFINDQYYTYTIYADVTDPKGETQQGEQTISVGDKSLFILAEIGQKIEKNQDVDIEISTETLNGEKLNSIVRYALYRLAESDVYAEKLDTKTSFKESEKVLSGSFETKNKKLNLVVNKLTSGRYKMIFTTTDAHGKEVNLEKVFILYGADDKRPPIKSYVWLLTPKTECEVGEKAVIHFGTSTKNSMILYEVMQGNNVLESRWISFSDETKTFVIPFKESYGSGVNVLFSFIKDEQLFHESIKITRKEIEKKLTPSLTVFRDKLKPGEKAEWTITIPEIAKSAKTAELLVGMYDESLDQLRPHSWSFYPVYRKSIQNSPQWTTNDFVTGSDFVSFNFYVQKTVHEFQNNRLNWFGLSFSNRNPIMIRGRLAGVKMESSMQSSSLNEMVVVAYGSQRKVAMTGSVSSFSDAQQDEVLNSTIETPQVQKPVQIRTNFNETAFFYPQLRTDAQGNVKFTFTAPESLTRWNVKMLAHTEDLYFGKAQTQVITQKDLMVQMNLPRFVRRSDKLVLSANVINLTNKAITANVQFEMIDPATEKVIFSSNAAPISSRRGVGGEVVLSANETKSVECELTGFSNLELVICKVVAQAGNFSDGEQKYLPVLPDKILVTESMPLTIRGNETRSFSFENLLNNGSKVDSKSLTIEFSSNPSWYAVQALPTLAVPESDNAIDYFTAYYVNSLASFIANSNPKIAATFDSWKNAGGSREALLSNLEKNKELKNMLLEETPWVMAAKDETEQKRQIALLFDLNMQKNQAKKYLDKLKSLQLPSGGFSWFKGMVESRFVTQKIILNLARLNKMTGNVNYEMTTINSALNYLDLEIVHDFENLKKYNKNYDKEMSIGNMQLFYLHLRSEYPTIPVHVSAQEALRFYTGQSEKYWTNFTLYGKATMAIVAQRNGKIQLAGDILKSLKENALKTDEFGMYWAKNIPGYFWNERPIAVQSAIIEVFAEISPNDNLSSNGTIYNSIEEMKIWLLKQKQTQRWDSPIATVDAIYALLKNGTDWLSNTKSVNITVGNVLVKPQSVEAGTGYVKQTFQSADIQQSMGNVKVSINDSFTPNETINSRFGIGWGAMYWQYYQDLDKVSGQSGPLKITKNLFVEKMTSTGKTLVPINQTELKKGDKIVTRLVITTDRNLEFVALKDLRAACFEPVNQLSGCEWKEGVCYYQTTKDASTQFFFSYLPVGTYVFEYEQWANSAGEYTSGIASLQCQYAPEFVSHTGGERIKISQK